MIGPRIGFYITGGNVPADADSYVTRAADGLLLESLAAGEFCYILTSRQMGKSSLMTRAVRELRDCGITPVVLDLSSQGFHLSRNQWYNGLLDQLGRRLKLEDEIEEALGRYAGQSPLQQWQSILRDVVLTHLPGKLTIFIDEIDLVRKLPFSTDEFFAAIRSCYNVRAEDPAYLRLNFCLLGVATPAELIADQTMTPFNIGVRIELSDFSREEAAHLEHGLARSPAENRSLMDRIYFWTHGHPYLTQQLCKAVFENQMSPAKSALGRSLDKPVDRSVELLYLAAGAQRQDSNLHFVQRYLLSLDEEHRSNLLTLYSRVERGKTVLDSDTNDSITRMKLAGIVRAVGGRLQVRNRIYSAVFGRAWIADKMPDAEHRRQRIAYRRGLARAGSIASAIIFGMGLLTLWASRAQFDANRFRARADQAAKLSQQRRDDAERASYSLTMNLIQREWEQHNIVPVLDMLESTRASRFRDFEWGYWNRICHMDVMTLKQHMGNIGCIAYSQNGRWLATGCADGTANVWNAQSGSLEFTIPAGPPTATGAPSSVNGVAFSPDSKTLLVGAINLISILDLSTRRAVCKISYKVSGVTSVAFAPDGKTVAAGVGYSVEGLPNTRDCVAVIWDAHTGRMLHLFKTSTDALAVKSVAYSPDGRSIVTGNYDQTIRVWDIATGSNSLTIWDRSNVIASVAYSPDGKHILAAGKRPFVRESEQQGDNTGSQQDGTVKQWNASTGRIELNIKGYISVVKSVAYAPDGKSFASAGYDNTVRVWNATTGGELATFRGHRDYVVSVAFSPDGARVASGSYDRTARVWDLRLQAPESRRLQAAGRVTSVALNQDGSRCVASIDNTPAMWDATTGRQTVTHQPSHQSPSAAAMVAEVWEIASGRRLLAIVDRSAFMNCAVIVPGAEQIWTGGSGAKIDLWASSTGRRIQSVVMPSAEILAVAASPTGNEVAVGFTAAQKGNSDERVSGIWSGKSGLQKVALKGYSGAVKRLCYSPDGRFVAAACDDRMARLWDVKSGSLVKKYQGHLDQVNCEGFSPDGSTLVTGADDNTAILWDLSSGRKRLTLRGHRDNIAAVAFSPDGRRIATASDDQTVKLWDADTGQDLLTLRGHTRAVKTVAFTPDGRQIVTGSWDKTLRVWSTKFD